MTTMIKRILPLAIAAALVGCGGGGGGSDTPAAAAMGKVIDGYVSGATVFLDMNGNGQLDGAEPRTVSTEGGDYRLELSTKQQQCAQYVPIVVDVPVGAEDEDLGPVEDAYQMVIAPPLQTLSDEYLVNVTPLTSLVWQTVQQELYKESAFIGDSCDALLADAAKRERLATLLADATAYVVDHYNIAADKIAADYIADNDQAAYDTAQAVVKGLQASLKGTVALQELHPQKHVSVNFARFSALDAEEAYPLAWYRTSYISDNSGSQYEHMKMNDALTVAQRLIISDEIEKGLFDGGDFLQSIIYQSRGGDDSDYNCDLSEQMSFMVAGKQYTISNLEDAGDTGSIDACQLQDFASADSRYLFVNYEQGETRFSAQYIFFSDGNPFSIAPEAINFPETASKLNLTELAAEIANLPYGWDDGQSVPYDVSRWVKSKTYPHGDDEYRDQQNSDGEWTRTITYANGTHEQQCSDDGQSWGDCGQ
ncbi:hypothetical protein [uncultured Ferrimonas sp.]|uniref:hypothetical protein n=1 Tax=uncultured Ferrimonas sp. TaxID=432640 RepID=UPI002609BCEE|nr:hypothetical protein [uncultured Ferrimonas sp.]